MIKDKKLLINILLLVLLLSFVGIMAIRENKLKNTESVVVEDFSTEENLEKSENEGANKQNSTVTMVSDKGAYEEKTNKYEIVDVTGLWYEKAESELKKIGFKNITGLLKKGSTIDLSKGIVTEQNYSAGESVREDEVIVLTCIESVEYFGKVFDSLDVDEAKMKAQEYNLKMHYTSEEIEGMDEYIDNLNDDARKDWIIESIDNVSDDNVVEAKCKYVGEGIIGNGLVDVSDLLYEIGGLPLGEALEKLSVFSCDIKCYYAGKNLTDYESDEYYVIYGTYYEKDEEMHLIVQTKYIMENANGYKDVLEHRIPSRIARDYAENYLREMYGDISFAGYYPHEVMMDNGKYDTWRINGGCKISGEEKSYKVYVTGTKDAPVIIDYEISDY